MFGGSKPTFGATTTPGGFGFNNAATTSPFGAQQTFGKPTTPSFGQTPAFGQQNTSLFGATAPAGGLFGSGAATSFGAPATTQPSFGFGQQPQQQQQAAPLFGSNQPSQNASLFGQPSTSGFGGVKPAGFGFGTTQQAGTLFGQPGTSTPVAPGTSFSGFGGTSTANTAGAMFGSNTASFGQQMSGGGNAGSSIAKYQPSLGTDTLLKNGQSNNVSTKQHCITAMKEYDGKCLEEIRLEDYMANRKGPQAGAAPPGTGLFGTTATATPSLFGTTTNQPSTGLFGQQTQPASNPMGGFGAATNTLGGFGQQQNTAFGQTTQNNTMFAKPFGTPAATSTAPFSGFGAPANTNPFGTKSFGQQGTSLFGQPATSTAPSFGQQPTSSFGTFGQTSTNQTPSIFGQPAATSNTPAFGLGTSSAASTGFGGFGAASNTTAGGGLFGQKSAAGFGTSLFGATTSASTGFGTFGQTNTAGGGGGLFNSTFNKPVVPTFGGFGTQSTAPALGTGLSLGAQGTSLFGSTANKPIGGGLFGQPTAPNATSLFGSTFGQTNTLGGLGQNTMGLGQGLGSAQPQASIPIHQQIMALTSSPYGEYPIFKDLKPLGISEDALKPTNPAAQKPILDSNFKVSPKVATVIKLKPIGSIISKKTLFNGLEEYDSSVASFTFKPNAKRLILKQKSTNNLDSANQTKSNLTDTPEIRNRTAGSNVAISTSTPKSTETVNDETFRGKIPNTNESGLVDSDIRRASWLHSKAIGKRADYQQQTKDSLNELIPMQKGGGGTGGETTEGDESLESIVVPAVNSARNVPISANDTTLDCNSADLNETNLDISAINIDPNAAGVILQRAKYYTIPPLDKLGDYMTEEGRCIVPNLTIGRKDYGNVYFNEAIDITGLNLDEMVHFRHKEVIIYPDDENKPPVGIELNRKAQITLDQVWPNDKTLHEPIKDPDRLEAMNFEGKLRRVCDKHDMRFVEYRPETGSWVFRVNHFSKYGLSDSDEDDVPTDPKKVKLSVANSGAIAPSAPKSLLDLTVEKTNRKDVNGMVAFNSGQPQGLGYLATNQFNDEFSGDFSTHLTSSDSAKFLPTSPSAILAMDMGNDCHKVQLMKASFFHDDDYDGKSVASEQLDGRGSPDQIVPNRLYLDRFSTRSKGLLSTESSSAIETRADSPFEQHQNRALTTIKEVEKRIDRDRELTTDQKGKLTRPVGPKSVPLIVKPSVALVKLPGTVIPLAKSIASRFLGKCSVDVAFINSRRFKIGWAEQNKVFILGTQENCSVPELGIDQLKNLFKGRSDIDSSRQIIQAIKISSMQSVSSPFNQSIEDHLQAQLAMSKWETLIDSDCPWIISIGGTQLLRKHYELSAQNLKTSSISSTEYVVSVWSLCNALWSDQEDLDGQDTNSHATIMRRKELLSDWLEVVVAQTNQTKDSTSSSFITESITGYLNHLLNLLSCHKVADASQLAFNNNDMNLALLIAQLSGGAAVRQLIHHQLASWQEVEADKFIAINRLKVFMLLAGIPLLSSVNGTINIYEDFDWLTSFALHIWYLCSTTSSITDALIGYEKSFKSDDFRAMAPIPPYSAEYQPERNAPVEDLRYHILKLYSKRSHPLECLLNPATHTSDPIDFRLSWLLLESLKPLGYHHCPEYSECQLHTSFASQLENYGLWHWAIFVLLHISNREQRELSAQTMLYKYIDLSDDDVYLKQESFVIEQLGIPMKWIYWAKAVRAGAMKKYNAQADFLLKSKQWNLAHEIIFNEISSDAVINDNMDYLRELLERFEDPRQVPNWSNQGMILLDYMEITKKFESLKTIHEDDIEMRWEGLKPQLSELFSRITQFPCPTAKHRLCQSEIAQRLANLISGVRIMCPELDPCILTHATLQKLPLPQEYAQQKMRSLLEDRNLVDILQQRSG